MGKSLEEMCRLVTGHGAWHIGDMHVSDGPHGIRAQDDGAKNNDSYEATCFPTASGAACSWNTELIGEMGKGLAQEAKALGVSVVLGPGVNIKRSPLCGRNFEYYSEDPFLAGELASSYIVAMQESGVGASLKHFAGNSQETHRMTSNSMIDDRALHEIYLRAFEKAVKKAKPATVMASYNYLNGVPACENKQLLTEILRDDWKYEGLVMSDWGACVDLPACITAGMDVEMPDSCGNHYDEIWKEAAVNPEFVKKLECSVERIEKLKEQYQANRVQEEKQIQKRNRTQDGDKNCISQDVWAENHKLAERIAEESAVLLKNDGFFPLRGRKEILLVGELADKPRVQGGGSSHINTSKVDGFSEQFEKYGIKIRYVRGYKATSFQRSGKLEREAVKEVIRAKEQEIPVLFFGGLTDLAEGEGYDRESFRLPENQACLLEKLLEVNDQIGFLSFGGAPYDMELPSKCKALLHLYLGGEAVAGACVKLILGICNPSGKLAESIPYSEKDVPCHGYFGKQGEQSGHLDEVEYRESIFVGYRYYDTFDVPVRYCFGYGLSYTTFAYSDLHIERSQNGKVCISFQVKNTGDAAGSEISEVYVKNPESDSFRANKELRGFAKTFLNPGEKKKVEIALDDRAFCVYQNGEFQVIGGIYQIQVGASLQDIRLAGKIEVIGTEINTILKKSVGVPLSEKEFRLIYRYPFTHFSDLKPGEFTTKNSLRQMQAYSKLARRWMKFGKIFVKLLYFPKSMKDPEARMMLEGVLEGNIDSVCNQSGGVIKKETIRKIVDSANRGKRV